ncbi:MAG: glycosyltransferase family 2 protein [Pseudomonadota bacterium]
MIDKSSGLSNNKPGYQHLHWAVVIPAFNEELTIKVLIEEIIALNPKQLIVVNDCSSDKTANILQQLPVTCINNENNLGKAASLWIGFEKAIAMGADMVITLDGDGQHDPRDIPRLLQKYEDNPQQIIIGARKRNPETQPFARYFANKFANFWVSWAAGYRISDSQSGFRVYPSLLLKELVHFKQNSLQQGQGFVFESEVLIEAAWQNIYSSPVEIEAIYPEQRRASHFKPLEDIMNITRMVAARLFKRKMYLAGLFSIIFNTKKMH